MNSLRIFSPEISLVLGVLGLSISQIFYRGEKVRFGTFIANLSVLNAVLQLLLLWQRGEFSHDFESVFQVDSLALFFKLSLFVLTFVEINVVTFTQEIKPVKRTLFYLLILILCSGLSFLTSATDLFLIFVVLLMVNSTACLIPVSGEIKAGSNEACLRYYSFSVLATIIYLLSITALFGVTQHSGIQEVFTSLPKDFESSATLPVGLILISLFFYLSIFPMIFWLPDTLEGCSSPAGIVYCALIPLGVFPVVLRFLSALSSHAELSAAMGWRTLIATVSVATLLVAAWSLLRQKSLKRFIGFLAVVGAGFSSLAVILLPGAGLSLLLFGVISDALCISGALWAYSLLREHSKDEMLGSFRGMLMRSPSVAVLFLFFLASLAGIPPLPGFISRVLLLNQVMGSGHPVLALVALFSIILLWLGYGRVAYALTGKGMASSDSNEIKWWALSSTTGLVVLSVPVICLTVFSERLLAWAREALTVIF